MHSSVSRVVQLFAVLLIATAASGATTLRQTPNAVPGEVLVKIRSSAPQNEVKNLEKLADADEGEKIADLKSGRLWRMKSRTKNTEALTKALAHNPHIEYVEPNYILKADASPNDPSYAQLWALHNTGQNAGGYLGAAGSDISAEAAWNVTVGSRDIVIGVVDTGIDYTHPDLVANIWSNPGGKGNPACGAGTHGFNAITRTCDPRDDHHHGTHVAGTIGATGKNSLGVTGVNWFTSIMGLKFLDAQGNGTTADAVAAIDFAVQAKIDGVNVRVLSNSWGGGNFSKALLDEINKANEHDILFVASAGNSSINNDAIPAYPASYASPNMISVAATDNRDGLAYFSNFGVASVHLGAPGVSILSTSPNGTYTYLSGTSMAAPHVSGVAALVLANTPSMTTAQVRNAILSNTDPVSSLSGKTVTGGRLNAAKALGAPLGPDFTLTVAPAVRTIVRGSSTTFTVTINPENGFTDSVDLSVNGLPIFSNAPFTPDPATSTSTLTVTTTASTWTGYYPLHITGTAPGFSRSATVYLYVTSTTTPVNACPSFSPRTTYASTGATAVDIGDLNRDGRNDLAVANVSSNRVAILLGNDNGTFQSAVSYVTGTAPIGVAVGDFNGDGNPDVATANSGSNNVSVLLGNGDGSLQTAAHHTVGTSPFSLATGDFDGNGITDLATANNGSSNVSILLGQGNGTFRPAVHYAAGSGPFSVATGDFDHDGRADLAVAAFNANKVSVLMGNGDGTFDAAVDYAAGTGPSSVAIGDVNGDGRADLAVANYGSDNVSVLRGQGNGAFLAAVNYPVGDAPYSVATGDFNADGKLDLVSANNEDTSLSVLMGTGSGTFLAAMRHDASGGPSQVAVGDFNADGRADLVSANIESGELSVHLNNGTCSLNCNTFAPAADQASGPWPDAVVAGDLNADGKADLIVTNKTANEVSIRLGNGDGTFGARTTKAVDTTPDAMVGADFNRDGRLDLAVANSGSNNVSILLGNGDGTVQNAVAYAAGTAPRGIVAGDFDRDGNADLAFAGGANAVSILRGNGDGTFGGVTGFTAGTSPSAIATHDFNRDGKLDLAVANAGSNNISILLGIGNATFQAATHFNAGTAPSALFAADLNRDGKADLAVANRGSNNVSVLYSGNGAFLAAAHHGAGLDPSSITAADFDGDGKLDLAVGNNSSHNVSVLRASDGIFATALQTAAGAAPTSVTAADFNRDGKPDLAVANSGADSVSILLEFCPIPDLAVTKTHSGSFVQGSGGNNYTITVTNAGTGPTDAPVTLTDTLPAGVAATAMSGTGWTCTLATTTCTRSDVLAAGASYPAITLTVTVGNGAAATVTNRVSVSGGGELHALNNTANDETTITPVTDLIVTSTHSGSFAQGNQGHAYTITARNAGGLATNGSTITVTETLPAGLTATAIGGSGWNCDLGSLTCTRSGVLAARTNAPPITLLVTVASNAPSLVTNVASVAGGGQTNTGNDTAHDPTIIWATQSCSGIGQPVIWPTGYGSSAVATADFNADGKQDLAVTNAYNGRVSVLLGIGNGTFQPAVHYAIGSYAAAIVTGDMNNDGTTDLVIANGSEGVAVLFGNGDGTFGTAVRYTTLAHTAVSVVLADFNGDGALDVVLNTSTAVSMLLNSGNGTLQSPVIVGTVNYSSGFTAADFNGDGMMDLAIVREGVRVISVLSGLGTGAFQAPVNVTTPYDATTIATGDFNRDGKPDLLTTSYYQFGFSIFIGAGNGTFQPAANYTGGSYGNQSVAIEDLNGDGNVDLAISNTNSSSIWILRGSGGGTFVHSSIQYAGSGSARAVVSDFNGDGRADMASAAQYTNGVAVMLGGCVDLTIEKTHVGEFMPGQTGASYSLKVRNVGGGASSGTVTVTDSLPNGLTATAISGSGWTCTLGMLACTRNDGLPAGVSYPPITVIVSVAANAPPNVVNVATVSGGEDTNGANNSASDPTTILYTPDLTLTMSHSGTFVAGQTGQTYTIIVGNVGHAPTTGTVTVTDNLPGSLIATAIAGSGWTCTISPLRCTRTDTLAASATYPPITLTVTVDPNALSSITNVANVSGDGETNVSNNFANDPTQVLIKAANLTAVALSSSYVSLTWATVPYATNYQVLRGTNISGPYEIVGTPLSSTFNDTSVSANTAYLYKVRASDAGVLGPLSNADMATTVVFTDDPLPIGTPMKIAHILELRTAVNVLRTAANLPAAAFTDATLSSGMGMKAVHVTELRTKLDEARAAIGLTPWLYGLPLGPGGVVRAQHIRDVRLALK